MPVRIIMKPKASPEKLKKLETKQSKKREPLLPDHPLIDAKAIAILEKVAKQDHWTQADLDALGIPAFLRHEFRQHKKHDATPRRRSNKTTIVRVPRTGKVRRGVMV